MHCEVLGLKTEYERRGEGRPILILHGWGSSIQAMAPVANCVAALGYEAVSLAFPVQMLMIAFSVGTSVGVNALLSKTVGRCGLCALYQGIY